MKSRVGNIECLRFLFAVCIVLHHAMIGRFPMWGGFLSVEFFYILSGAFMGKSIRKKEESANTYGMREACIESSQYCWRRIKGIMPYFFVSTIIGTFILGVTYDWRFNLENILNILNDFLFLQSYGFPVMSVTGVVWYLSSMFFAMWILYPIARNKYYLYTYYIAPILAFVFMGQLIKLYGTLNVPAEYLFGVVCTGNMRAIGMISLGFVVNEVSNKLASKKNSKYVNTLLTIIEIILYLYIFWYMHIWNESISRFDEVEVFAMAIALSITLSGKSVLQSVFDNKFSIFLGKYSVSLFLSHFYWVQNIQNILYKLGYSESLRPKLLGIIMSFVTALGVMICGDFLKNIVGKYKEWYEIKYQMNKCL